MRKKWKIFHLIYFEKIWTNYDKYLEEIFTNKKKILWKKKEELYKFLMKLLSKLCENLRKMLREFKKTHCYSIIWKEKNVVELDLKKTDSVPCKAGQNGVKRYVAGRTVISGR